MHHGPPPTSCRSISLCLFFFFRCIKPISCFIIFDIFHVVSFVFLKRKERSFTYLMKYLGMLKIYTSNAPKTYLWWFRYSEKAIELFFKISQLVVSKKLRDSFKNFVVLDFNTKTFFMKFYNYLHTPFFNQKLFDQKNLSTFAQ